MSIRAVWFAFWFGVVAAVLAAFFAEALIGPAFAVGAVGYWLAIVMSDDQMMRCDACQKRVKLGATTCHHCGYSRA